LRQRLDDHESQISCPHYLRGERTFLSTETLGEFLLGERIAKKVDAGAGLFVPREAAYVIGGEVFEKIAIDVLTLNDERFGLDVLEVTFEIANVPLTSNLLFRLVIRAFGDERDEPLQTVGERFE
jgi:hypothetical protein